MKFINKVINGGDIKYLEFPFVYYMDDPIRKDQDWELFDRLSLRNRQNKINLNLRRKARTRRVSQALRLDRKAHSMDNKRIFLYYPLLVSRTEEARLAERWLPEEGRKVTLLFQGK